MSTVGELLDSAVGVDATLRGAADVRVTAIDYDSRVVQPGSLFCCLPGAHADGHDFAAAAVERGATALLAERPLDLPVAQLVTPNARQAMALLSAAFYGHPSRQLQVVGVTGTAGKTTTTHLIAAICEAAGRPATVLGTLSGQHTTPEAPEFQAKLAEALSGGSRAIATEVSSHALELHRVDGTRFAVGVFTNLGRDHLDFHGSVERYFAAKARLFTLCEQGVVNVDDVHGRLLVDAATIPITPFSVEDITELEVTPTQHAYTWRGVRIRVSFGGGFNVSNSLAAATAGAALGIDPTTIAAGLDAAEPVPGRFEPVDAGQDFAVLVDYAHTPESLAAVLEAAKQSSSGRVIAVFGAGGDRDRDKRPQMGATAAAGADLVVLTSDNPRSEDPMAIIDAVAAGIAAADRDRLLIEPDREAAIAAALRSARTGDVVVIAGKGHENTQTIGTEVKPFDDRVVARRILARSNPSDGTETVL